MGVIVGLVVPTAVIGLGVAIWLEARELEEILDPGPKSAAIDATAEILCPNEPERFVAELAAYDERSGGGWTVYLKDDPDGVYFYGGISPAGARADEFVNSTRASCGAPPYLTPTYPPPITPTPPT
jgi:hypothetical protein